VRVSEDECSGSRRWTGAGGMRNLENRIIHFRSAPS
jgi:hypothetical protein